MAAEPTGLIPGPIVGVTEPTAISFGHHTPFFDVIDALPPQAAERLRALRLRAKESHAVVPEFEASPSRLRREDRCRQCA